MTNSAATPVVAPSPYVVTAAEPAFDRWRWLLAGVIGILGGYLAISSAVGALLNALSGLGGFPPEFLVLLVGQAVFAVLVTVFAYSVAPGTLVRRILAVLIFTLGFVGTLALMFARIYSGLGLPGAVSGILVNPFWLVLFLGALGWLLASGARPLAFLGLLLTFVVLPLNYVFVFNGISSALSTAVQFVVCLVVAVIILLISRPAATPTAFVAMDEGAAVVEEPLP